MTLEQDGFQVDVTCVPPSTVGSPDAMGHACDSCRAPLGGSCDPDAALLCRFARAGDGTALDEFLIRHDRSIERAVRSACRRGTPEDTIDEIRQEVFLKIMLGASTFQCWRSAEAWVRGIAWRTVRGHFRPRGQVQVAYISTYSSARDEDGLHNAFNIEPIAPDDDPADDPEIERRKDRIKERVNELVRSLPEHLQAVWVRRREGMSYAQIAADLNINPSTVGTRLLRAKRMLGALL